MIEVKALSWTKRKFDNGNEVFYLTCAYTPFGVIIIHSLAGAKYAFSYGPSEKPVGQYPSEATAIAAAEEDYRTKVISAVSDGS